MSEDRAGAKKVNPRNDGTLADFCYFPPDVGAEGPILGATVRSNVHQWLKELGWAEDLQAVGLEPRRRAFFDGPPGCGKTTLAHHIAQRLGLILAVIDLQAIASSFVNGTGRNVGQLFNALEPYADRLVVFLDEFDAIGTKRTEAHSSGTSEGNKTVIALLQRMDRYRGLLIAASNRGKDIDPALWRRFDMHLTVDLPDDEARWAIVTRYLAPYEAAQDVVDILAEATAGATPAILRQLCENVKRDLVLAPRFKLADGAGAVLERAITSIQPAAEMPAPSLWAERTDWLPKLAKLPWPPVQRAQGATP